MLLGEYFFNSASFYTIYLIFSGAILLGLKVLLSRPGADLKFLALMKFFMPYFYFFGAFTCGKLAFFTESDWYAVLAIVFFTWGVQEAAENALNKKK